MTMLLADIGYQSNWIEILQADFMRNALIGGTLVALVSGIVGYFVVIRRDAFAAHALAHIGFPGATFAVLVGMPVTLGLVLFCVTGGLAIGALGKRVTNRDISTGTVLALATGLGVLFASLATENTRTVTNVLFGNLLAISTSQIQVFAGFAAVLVSAFLVIGRPLLFASIDPQVAEAKGVGVRSLGVMFTLLLALAVTMAVPVVGTLLLFALVVTPAATALAITARPVTTMILATVFSLGAVWLGLTLAVMFNLPPSFCIVSLAFLTWIVTLGATRTQRGARHGSPVGHHHDGDHHHPRTMPLSS